MVAAVSEIASSRSLRCVSEEFVRSGRFLVLFERHHVDRPMPSSRARIRGALIFDGKFVAGYQRDRRVGHQDRPLDAQLVQKQVSARAAVGLQLGRCGRQFARRSRARSSWLARGVQQFRQFLPAVPALAQIRVAASLSRASPALRSASNSRICSPSCTFSFCRCTISALADSICICKAPARSRISATSVSMRCSNAVAERWRSSSVATRAARCDVLSAAVSRWFAGRQGGHGRRRAEFRIAPRLFNRRKFRLSRCGQAFLLCRSCGEPLQFAFADGDPFAHPRHLAVELFEQMSGCHRCFSASRFSSLPGDRAKKRGFDFARQSEPSISFSRRARSSFLAVAARRATRAHRKRTLAPLLAAVTVTYGKAFSGLREEDASGLEVRVRANRGSGTMYPLPISAESLSAICQIRFSTRIGIFQRQNRVIERSIVMGSRREK